MRSTTESRNGRRALLLGLALVLVVAALLMVFGAEAVSSPRMPEVRTVVVHSGDTLWEIADRSAPESADLRVVVRDLIARNGLESKVLQPGQVLEVPFTNT